LLLIVVLAGGYVVHWFLKHHPKREAQPEPGKEKLKRTLCFILMIATCTWLLSFSLTMNHGTETASE
jgi:hypothetical protein